MDLVGFPRYVNTNSVSLGMYRKGRKTEIGQGNDPTFAIFRLASFQPDHGVVEINLLPLQAKNFTLPTPGLICKHGNRTKMLGKFGKKLCETFGALESPAHIVLFKFFPFGKRNFGQIEGPTQQQNFSVDGLILTAKILPLQDVGSDILLREYLRSHSAKVRTEMGHHNELRPLHTFVVDFVIFYKSIKQNSDASLVLRLRFSDADLQPLHGFVTIFLARGFPYWFPIDVKFQPPLFCARSLVDGSCSITHLSHYP